MGVSLEDASTDTSKLSKLFCGNMYLSHACHAVYDDSADFIEPFIATMIQSLLIMAS